MDKPCVPDPIVLVEALAAGTPIIVPDYPGFPGIVTPTGRISLQARRFGRPGRKGIQRPVLKLGGLVSDEQAGPKRLPGKVYARSKLLPGHSHLRKGNRANLSSGTIVKTLRSTASSASIDYIVVSSASTLITHEGWRRRALPLRSLRSARHRRR